MGWKWEIATVYELHLVIYLSIYRKPSKFQPVIPANLFLSFMSIKIKEFPAYGII